MGRSARWPGRALSAGFPVAVECALVSGFCLVPQPHASAAVRYRANAITIERGPVAREAEAQKLTLDAWIAEARRIGAAWASWRLAIDRDIQCRTESKGAVTCLVTAAPCAIAENPARLPLGVTAGPGDL